ncbi:hypothetical protein Agub_g10457 [Astrephomene gubernaculifera]|uniref:N-acetyltransferase domain-containing protein n=1 Tax=Astrephomene gubernaculifera TaxID=47775 RepID=A0AAD3DWS8_9CHLO|nr:hypothetical protein Agub_g10457 [Astrephomene gubernaculifera]
MYKIEAGNSSSAKFIEELNALERSIFKKNDSWADGELERMVKKRNNITCVARLNVDGKVCGYVLCTSTGINVHVSKLAVREDCRRQGVAKSLMMAVLRTAATQRRSLSSTLHVALDNQPAVNLYRSLGFKEDGLLEHYYTTGRHAYKMICDLEPYKKPETSGSGSS